MTTEEPPRAYFPRVARRPSSPTSTSMEAHPSIKSNRQSSIFSFSIWPGRLTSRGNSIRMATVAERTPSQVNLVCEVCLRDVASTGAELECGHKFHSHCLKHVCPTKLRR